MLDIKSLERRWLKYKIKSYLPAVGGTLTIISVAALSLWWLNHETTEPKVKIQQVPVKKTTVVQPAKTKTVQEENSTVLEPSMDFVQSFGNAPVATEPVPQKPVAKPLPTVTKLVSSLPPPQVLTVPESPAANISSPKASASESKTLTINRNESKLDIEELQKRFKETSNANLGLFIARYYYDHGNYTEAYNYALKTNAINSKIDESWILFSKSLVKLGKTDQAKKTLQLYISQSNSDTAKELLNAVERGNFK